MAKLIGIAIREKKRAPMQNLDRAYISLDKGVENDFRGKASKRQVTVMSLAAWQEANAELDTELPWMTRRANLLVDELALQNTAGKTLRIGEVELLITQETDPCERMQEAADGLFSVLKVHWRGGVCCRVIREGQVTLGDEIILCDKSSS
jgi:MOSC domain-containing protein YiiM